LIRKKKIKIIKDRVLITYVEKAKLWCVTVWKKGMQKQHWFGTKQEAEDFKNE